MLPGLAARVTQWIRDLPRAVRPPPEFGEVLEARLRAGDSLKQALEQAMPRLGEDAVKTSLEAEDGPVALVCVDLLRSLSDQLHRASLDFGKVSEPWAQWTSARMADFATALEDDVVHSHLVNAVLAEAAVTSELIPIEVRRIHRRGLEQRVVQVLLAMRSTFFTPADLVQTASTLGRSVSSRRRLADA
ncbi:MAG: hypothetical protein JNJ54_14470 [Myxococcaceae bacterium]|nr:hypothetical protein [Myxococcaceae bacterium]